VTITRRKKIYILALMFLHYWTPDFESFVMLQRNMKGKISRQEVKLKALRHNPGSGDERPSTEREVGENVGEQSAARFSMTR